MFEPAPVGPNHSGELACELSVSPCQAFRSVIGVLGASETCRGASRVPAGSQMPHPDGTLDYSPGLAHTFLK